MAKYMMIYRGEATDLAEMSEEQAAAVLGKWQVWLDKVGPALVDVGSPFGAGGAIVDDGTTGPASSLSGYSIVEADDLDQAMALADDHPFLSEGRGRYAIDLFELMPVPF
ncbi:MAG: YciI family protein [Actinobacteria bacterium]|nr:YciI family protein [Actinomycetota bacterium]MCI0544850.1 YciI family protein [Actinomycetota bacterium]